jgi:hypothetical protein
MGNKAGTKSNKGAVLLRRPLFFLCAGKGENNVEDSSAVIRFR